MRRQTRRPRNLILPIIILIVGVILSRVERQSLTPRATKAPQSTFSGKVVGVADGDTIRVLYLNQEITVRLFGIDSPEKSQAYGDAAKRFTSKMVFGKDVTVESRGTDRYGRTVGWVTSEDGEVLNTELVRAGYAWWYTDYAPNNTELQNLESQARTAKRGLWSDKSPTPPWDFRKANR